MSNDAKHPRFLFRQSTPNWRLSPWFHARFIGSLLPCLLSFLSFPGLLPASASETITAATDQYASAALAGPSLLKGTTEIIEFNLSNLEPYRQGMLALEKKNFAGAEILFKRAAAELDEGYEKYRAQCLYFQAGCLVMKGKPVEAANLYKSAVKLLEQYDPQCPYKAMAIAHVRDPRGARARLDKQRLFGAIASQTARISIDQNIKLIARVPTLDTTEPFQLRVDSSSIPRSVYNCFAQMTCLETTELGSNINNAANRWQPLLVEGNPAAFAVGASYPVINVKVNDRLYKIEVNLPALRGPGRKILLVTDHEKICAIDLSSYETWVLRMKRYKDGALSSVQWTKLIHVKQRPIGSSTIASGAARRNSSGRITPSFSASTKASSWSTSTSARANSNDRWMDAGSSERRPHNDRWMDSGSSERRPHNDRWMDSGSSERRPRRFSRERSTNDPGF